MKALLCENKLNGLSDIGVSYSSVKRYAAVNVYVHARKETWTDSLQYKRLASFELENVLHSERHLAIASAEDLTV